MKRIKQIFINGYYLFFCFFVYCVIGWLYEVFLAIFVEKQGFVNRGYLFGPYLPVYGFGSLILLFLLYKRNFSKNKIINIFLMFIFVSLITTSLELIASYVMEAFNGAWLWNYNDELFNFQGRICPKASFRFGLGGMFFLEIVQPFLDKTIMPHAENKTFKNIIKIIFFVFLLDLSARPFLGSNLKDPNLY